MFDWENAIALPAMQGNRASSRGEGEVSWVFSSCGILKISAVYVTHGLSLTVKNVQ